MRRVFLSPAANEDIVSILAWSENEFGEQARLRYEALLVQAVLDLQVEPLVLGSMARDEISLGLRTYHLRYSRDHISKKVGRVRHPRHFIIYRIKAPDIIEIGRVLHESMDLNQHLPDDVLDE